MYYLLKCWHNDGCVICKRVTGNRGYLQFYLSNYTDIQSLENAIRRIPYCNENTNTAGVLQLTRTEVFNTANGDRPDVPDVIILITDGNPTGETDRLPDEVLRIKNLDIRIVGVGITNQVTIVCYLLVCRKLNMNVFYCCEFINLLILSKYSCSFD